MKKLILILSILAAPFFANAETDYTITSSDDGFAAQTSEVQPDRNYSRSYDFGRVWVGQRRYTDFVLQAGRFPLQVRGLSINGRFFGGDTNCPSLLFPGQRCIIRASYAPRMSGNHYGQLRLWVANDTMIVHLSGRAWDGRH
ncbi:hypothetical protein AZI86_02605 [Bdellovibrio bacteriovorus]|uniref:Uncharacterized protein n=1 Tax=Bdellovibrio bacteriovorus TaxID=959 RepID=A0A150WNU2_BDEBC|nr:hypothetical protein [Bdellovibrio bacteriovorus]KYG65977.1 hypothetical protein AZI86_02605 [Bdellovibrio bacteriovorus]